MFRRFLDAALRSYFRTRDHKGKYRLVRWLGRHVVPHEGLIVNVPPGVRLRLHPRDWIEYTLLCGEPYEPMTLNFLTANLRPGDTAIFAGVNFGLHVVVACNAVGPSGTVIGFEPQPAALLRAYENLSLNGLTDRAQLVAMAVGCDDRVVRMAWSRAENPGAASLLDHGPGLAICVGPLSRVLVSLSSPVPRLLLLDVQGYELSALEGLAGGGIPELVVVEADPEFLGRAGIGVDELVDRLTTRLGYRLFHLTGEPVRAGESAFPERNIVGVQPATTPVWVSNGRQWR
jgi:FkbM family methyltransferase